MNVPWNAAAGLSLLIAAIYFFKCPHPRRAAHIWQRVILRWAHGSVWLVLGVSFVARSADWPGAADVANGLALVSAALYATFMAILVQNSLRVLS
jgi:hypothetical protein